jgi:hypothetical protein
MTTGPTSSFFSTPQNPAALVVLNDGYQLVERDAVAGPKTSSIAEGPTRSTVRFCGYPLEAILQRNL